MIPSLTDVGGLLVGHAQDPVGATGCTVVLCPEGAICGVSVAGGGPGTRETDCLRPENLVEKVQAVYLGGGSAYGLAGADGVMTYCEERGWGIDVGCGVVPVVPGAILFDLPVGSAQARPTAAMGYQACVNASSSMSLQGNVGAGTGASVGKTRGPRASMKGGLGMFSQRHGDLVVGALVAVNCFGDVKDPLTGAVLAGTLGEDGKSFAGSLQDLLNTQGRGTNPLGSNTTLAVVAVNKALTKAQATKVAQMAQDGLARTIDPIHTLYDGDTVFCLATGQEKVDVTAVGALAARVLAQAVANAVREARSAYGLPSHQEISQKGNNHAL